MILELQMSHVKINRPGQQWRDQAYREPHPMNSPIDLVIQTPMMDQLIKHLKGLLFNQDSGACLLGGHRIGKTTALEEIQKQLNQQSELPAYCHYYSVDALEVKSIKQMYKLFCYQENIKPKFRADGLQMRELIIHRIVDRFLLSGKRQIILFIDELQKLSTQQLQALASLHDIFRNMKVNLCIVFVGNTVPSQYVLKAADKKSNRLIYGRFFENQKAIYGIKTQEQLEACLSQFDQLCFPEGGPSYTQYFVHEDAPKDWKLASLTDLIWDVYIKQFWPKIKGRHESFGMKYFINMVRALLMLKLNKQWTDDPVALRKMIVDSIRHSKIVAEQVKVVK